MVRMRAPFPYWGSKNRMAPWIIERLPPHKHFVEACAGSAAIMAVKEPVEAETVNDVYGEVVNFFRVLRDKEASAELIDLVSFTPYAHEEFIEAGKLLEECDDLDSIERAWAFFIRMVMAVVPGKSGWSYSVGAYSFKKANKTGRWASMPELLRKCAERFERVQVTNWDICDLIDRMDTPEVLVFVDPPYIFDSRPSSSDTQSAYVHDDFNHEDFIQKVLSAKNASFAITHYPHPLYDENFINGGDFISHRNIANKSNKDGRSNATERLYLLEN